LKIPTAIVLVATENDVVLTVCTVLPSCIVSDNKQVKLAVELGIPFVPKSGGHSLWSTIGDEGFILDLSLLKRISIDTEEKMVTVESGVLIKEVNDAAFERGLCLGRSNTFARTSPVFMPLVSSRKRKHYWCRTPSPRWRHQRALEPVWIYVRQYRVCSSRHC
jgi:hypothetical protein